MHAYLKEVFVLVHRLVYIGNTLIWGCLRVSKLLKTRKQNPALCGACWEWVGGKGRGGGVECGECKFACFNSHALFKSIVLS